VFAPNHRLRRAVTTLVGGPLSATLLTLFVLPVLYEIVRPAVPLRGGQATALPDGGIQAGSPAAASKASADVAP